MSDTTPRWSRAGLSVRLLRFAAEHAIATREMERRVAGLDPRPAGYEGIQAVITGAKAWEAAVLWVAWRLRPRSSAGI
jgi:hypothetical protein